MTTDSTNSVMAQKREEILNNSVKIRFTDGDEQGFRKVRETLKRIGVKSKHEQKLFQSAHILQKKGSYYILHFKQLFEMDGRPTSLSESDIARRNFIANLLREWGMVEIINPEVLEPMGNSRMVKVLKHAEAKDYVLEQKYDIGGFKRKNTGN